MLPRLRAGVLARLPLPAHASSDSGPAVADRRKLLVLQAFSALQGSLPWKAIPCSLRHVPAAHVLTGLSVNIRALLMENIVHLESYRKARKLAPGRSAPDAPRFFCLSCDADQFKLYACGTVHCAACGALIRNVEVSDTQAK